VYACAPLHDCPATQVPVRRLHQPWLQSASTVHVAPSPPGFVLQVTLTFVTGPDPIVPAPLPTTQVCAGVAGWVITVTA